MMPGYDGMMDGSFGPWVLVVVLLATAVSLGVAGVWALRRRVPETAAQPDAPVELLRSRLAAGEIDEDEYLRRRSVIGRD